MQQDGEATSLTIARAWSWLRRRPPAEDVGASPQTPPPPPAQDSMQEQVRNATFRVRNLSCLGAGTGAGFAIAPHVVVTNRHVVEGADPLEVTTWEGQLLEVDVAATARDHDLAVLRTVRTLERSVELAHEPAREGDLVRVVGYPLGGEFTVVRGIVVDQVEGPVLGDQSQVLRVKAVVLPGYSGGPILNVHDEAVGVVYALGQATRYALAIPTSSLSRWLESASP